MQTYNFSFVIIGIIIMLCFDKDNYNTCQFFYEKYYVDYFKKLTQLFFHVYCIKKLKLYTTNCMFL